MQGIELPRSLRALINISSILVIGWIGYVIYGSFANAGIWRVLVDLFKSDATGRYSPAGVFSAAALIGIGAIGVLAWAVWRVFLRKESPTA